MPENKQNGEEHLYGTNLEKQAQDANVPSDQTPEQEEIARILKEVKLPARDKNTTAPQEESGATSSQERPTVEDTAPAGTPPPQAEEVAEQEKTTTESDDIPALRTFRHDLQGVVQDNNMSVVRAAALEQAKRGSRVQEVEVEAHEQRGGKVRRFSGIAALIIALLVLGGGALGAIFLFINSDGGTSSTPVASESLIFAEQTFALPLSESSVLEAKHELARVRAEATLTLGAITRIVPTISTTTDTGALSERPRTTEEFFRVLSNDAPAALYRALDDRFFLGIHTIDNNYPVIIVPVESYERAFAALLSWEDNMNTALAPFFTPAETATTGTSTIPQQLTFTDEIIRNYDVRVLRDSNGVVRLLYAFPSRDLLIIAESPYTFVEVLSRLRAERRL